jgi:hypothetical protein
MAAVRLFGDEDSFEMLLFCMTVGFLSGPVEKNGQ